MAFDRPATSSTTSPSAMARLGNTCSTGRPTISRTSSASVVSAVSPSPTLRPSRRQTQRSLTPKISSNLWLMNRIARPSARSAATSRNSSSISWRDSAAVGSSMMTTRASWLSARATSTMCFCATDSRLSGASASKSASIRASSAAVRARISGQSISRPPGIWPMNTFSATDSSSNITVSWWIAAIPAAQEARGVSKRAGAPATRIWPASGW